MPLIYPFGFMARSVASVSFTDHAVSTADATAYTFTARAIGAAAGGRVIIVAISGGNGTAARTISSVTIGGVTASAVSAVQNANDGAFWIDTAIYAAQVDTGTTADIVVTWSAGQIRCGIGVWSALNLNSVTPTATATSTANPMSTTINVSAGGILIGHACSYFTSGVPTYTWTTLTEQYDETVEPNTSQTGAHNSYAAAQTALSVSCTPSSFAAGRMQLAALR